MSVVYCRGGSGGRRVRYKYFQCECGLQMADTEREAFQAHRSEQHGASRFHNRNLADWEVAFPEGYSELRKCPNCQFRCVPEEDLATHPCQRTSAAFDYSKAAAAGLTTGSNSSGASSGAASAQWGADYQTQYQGYSTAANQNHNQQNSWAAFPTYSTTYPGLGNNLPNRYPCGPYQQQPPIPPGDGQNQAPSTYQKPAAPQSSTTSTCYSVPPPTSSNSWSYPHSSSTGAYTTTSSSSGGAGADKASMWPYTASASTVGATYDESNAAAWEAYYAAGGTYPPTDYSHANSSQATGSGPTVTDPSQPVYNPQGPWGSGWGSLASSQASKS
jgi:hypothetical protein